MQNELGVTDGQLLDHYLVGQDSSAFREVVSRHGPAVLRVCRFVLHDQHEAEDAFQATFLLFIRRAPSIRNPQALGSWLCGVAYRVAARSRARLAKQRQLERKRCEMRVDQEEHDGPCPEIQRIVRHELHQLPEHYLAPLLLCYFQGLTHREAAKHLGWPAGTVKVRLVRGRNLLRERLDRRGIALGLAFLLLDWKKDAEAAIPNELVDSTIRVMRHSIANDRMSRGASSSHPTNEIHPATVGGHWISSPRRWILAGFLVLLVGISSHIAIARQLLTSERSAMNLPSNLTDVLGVDCH